MEDKKQIADQIVGKGAWEDNDIKFITANQELFPQEFLVKIGLVQEDVVVKEEKSVDKEEKLVAETPKAPKKKRLEV